MIRDFVHKKKYNAKCAADKKGHTRRIALSWKQKRRPITVPAISKPQSLIRHRYYTMYPVLGAIPTPTAPQGESGEVDQEVPNEYADEGQERKGQTCKKVKCQCSMRTIAVCIIFTISSMVAAGFLYYHLMKVVTEQSVPLEPQEVMFRLSSL